MWPFKPNDWKVIFVSEPDVYTVTITYAGLPLKGSEREKKLTHILYYSKSRNKYRIRREGDYINTNLKTSPSYLACIKKQIELENKQNV